MEQELPALIKAADERGGLLLWVYISAAGWEETQLSHFQAAHDTKTPIDSRPAPEREEVLKSVARQAKQVASRLLADSEIKLSIRCRQSSPAATFAMDCADEMSFANVNFMNATLIAR
jgi:hypothetical protein